MTKTKDDTLNVPHDILVKQETVQEFQATYTRASDQNNIREIFFRIITKAIIEFCDTLGINYRISNEAKPFITEFHANKQEESEIILAVIAVLQEETKKYESFYKMILNEQNADSYTNSVKLISVKLPILRDMALSNFSAEQIGGRFITEVQSNFPNLVREMSAKTALMLAKGVSNYTRKIQQVAEDEINAADARTNEALAAKETATTTEGIADAIQYWDAKYKNHRNAKWWMFIVFVAVLILGIFVVFFGESLLPGVPGGENGDPGYKWAHYLRVVVVPTLAVAWLLRLISRQFITHMLLQEDARLRQTLVRTFLGLQRNKNAEIADKERAHMLEAIFRPLSVTPSSDVNQPSFADIAKLSK